MLAKAGVAIAGGQTIPNEWGRVCWAGEGVLCEVPGGRFGSQPILQRDTVLLFR